MKAVILVCSTLDQYVAAAQQKMKTNYPVVSIDRKFHVEPRDMREQLIAALKELPEETDTVLVAMGFCGGSWKSIETEKRIVIPRVDDCITLLLHTDDRWYPNLKKGGHMYVHAPGSFDTLEEMRQDLCEKYGEKKGGRAFDLMFASYTNVDIIDTGTYDCYGEDYVQQAERNAALINSALGYVPGSNLLLEKLVSGNWDQQFIVAEPGQMLSEQDFLGNTPPLRYELPKV